MVDSYSEVRINMSKMLPKWRELAEKNLDAGDEILVSYPGELDREFGYLMLSNRRLQFVHEEGFLRKAYKLTLDLPYEKIGKIYPKSKYELDLTEREGKTHTFTTFEFPESIVEKRLKELMESSHA